MTDASMGPQSVEQAQEVPALEVQSLFFAYKKRWALRGITFSVWPRSVHGFVGPNGAGKTTTLKVLATLLRPRAGKVLVFGEDIRRNAKRVLKRIGFMPDHFSLYRQMTVFEYLDFFAAAYGLSLAERNRTIDDVLTLTDMNGRRDELIKSLSRGMQQRVSLARVLVHDPDLLLLDEPASGLDPRARIELMGILKELRRMGKTIFISSHILGELADLCDSVTIIDRGKERYSGSMEGLLARRGESASYVLVLAQENPPTVEALRSLDGVEAVTKEDEKPATYRVVLSTGKTDPSTILRVALDSGGRVVSFSEAMMKLSEAFMDLTEPGVPT